MCQAIAREVPEMLLGAGTVLSTAQAERAVACGAQFLVAPGTNAKVVRWASGRGVTMLPGVATATEVEAAMDLGLTHLKFFPAEQAGGLATLKALGAPYGAVRFMPTGGVSAANVGSYLKHPSILCAGGRHARSLPVSTTIPFTCDPLSAAPRATLQTHEPSPR
jgi:2-dehydro-3-deoxyphosphogluconate aldolase/(4S)-4-hydroxy-2-oxoglutarate aldolase